MIAAAGTGPIPTPEGELLCLPPFLIVDVAAGSHDFPIPNDCGIVGASVCAQAATASATAVVLQNALDVHIGDF